MGISTPPWLGNTNAFYNHDSDYDSDYDCDSVIRDFFVPSTLSLSLSLPLSLSMVSFL